MYLKTVVQIINCFTLISTEVLFEDPYNFPDYGNPSIQRSKDARQSFIKNKKRNYETARRIMLLDQLLSNDTMYANGIAHFLIGKTHHSDWKKVNKFETEFRYLIGMQGLKYTYRRDMFWRTWRLVHYKEARVVNYRYENPVNYTNDYSGYWIIEDKTPPCPFELFSLSKESKICAVHLNQYHNVKRSCRYINLSDLTGACDNPIVTEWHIQKRFNDKVSERFPSTICEGRQACTICTLYEIASDYISFRIVNSTNDVIYSRVMKPDKKNYACINNCGKMDPHSKTITMVENSLRINLLGTKNKREDILLRNIQLQSSNNNKRLKNTYLGKKIKKPNENYQRINNFMVEDLVTTLKAPTCKALKLSLAQDEMDED